MPLVDSWVEKSCTAACVDCTFLGGSFVLSPILLGIMKLEFCLDKPTTICHSTKTLSMDDDWLVDACFPFLLLVRGPLESLLVFCCLVVELVPPPSEAILFHN